MNFGTMKTWMKRTAVVLLIAWMLGLMAVQVTLEDPSIRTTSLGSRLHAELLDIFSLHGVRCR